MKQIENSIDEHLKNFISNISEKYDISSDDLMKIWDSGEKIVSCKQNTKAPVQTRTSPAKTDASSVGNGEGCPYVYSKGEKEGQTCNTKPKGGVVFCTRHKKYEGLEPKQKKILPAAKKSIAGNTSTSKKSPVTKEINTVLRKNKAIDRLWHSSTGMVFKSAKERIVIGRCVDDKLIPLTQDDIEVCMAHSFAYDSDEKIKDTNKNEEKDEESESESESEQVKTASTSQKSKTLLANKKSISAAIAETKNLAEDVELILSELKLKPKNEKIIETELFGDSESEEESDDLLEED